MLRSAYVTHMMSDDTACLTDLATSMRHSTREQARTYNGRMVGEKVSAVVARAANELNSVLGVQTPTNASRVGLTSNLYTLRMFLMSAYLIMCS